MKNKNPLNIALSLIVLILCPSYILAQTTLCSSGNLELTCGAGSCLSPYPDVASYAGINGRDNNYAVFIGGDLTITGGRELEGKGFVYGDFNFNNPGTNYNTGWVGVGSGVVPDANTDWLAIGGDLNFNGLYLIAGGTSQPSGEGIVRVKGSANSNDFFTGNGQLVSDPSLDLSSFDACFTVINTHSQCWAMQSSSPNSTYTSSFGTFTFSSTNGASGLYVFNLSEDMNESFSGTVDFQNFPNNATILINVDKPGSSDNVTLNIGSFTNISDELRQRIIWNFPDASVVTLRGGSQFIGSIVLPSRTSLLDMVGVLGFNGRIIAGGDVTQVASGSEFHNYSFEGDLSSLGCSVAPPSCSLTNAGETLETCNDNGTNTNPSDDYITFSLNPTGTNLGATYSVTANNGGMVTLAGGGAATGVSYNSATAFRLQNGSANGSTTYTITITDASGSACQTTTSVMENSCSGTCNLTSAGKTLETCNPNNSNANPSDDYITFSLNPIGTNLGASYSVTANNGGTVTLAGGGAATGVSYNSATAFRLQNGSANGSTTYTITITDASGSACQTTTSVMESSCSSGGGGSDDCTYRDEFSSVSYSNSDGTESWSTNWIEVNDGSNGPTGNSTCHQTDYVIYVAESGDCTYYTCPNGNSCLTINAIGAGIGDYIYRELDLSPAAAATLTYDFDAVLGGSDEVEMEIRTGASSWVTLKTYNSSSGSGAESIDISAYISSNTQIRFINTAASTGGDIGFDNIEISYNCASPCALTDAGESGEDCANNGTTSNSADDYIIFSLNPTGTNLGATYSVTANNGGTVTLAGGGAATGVSYGSVTAFRLQNGSADGSTNYTITVTDVSDGSCTATTTVMESSCSTTCNLTSAGKTLETCNPNSTNSNPSDDYITFSLNPTGTNLGATYSVTANNGGTVTLAGGGAATGVNYGSATAFRLQNGSANGSTNYTITVTDVSDGSCTATTTVMESSCSTTCNLTSAGKTLETCNPNSTNSNPSDDYITFSLNPTGTNLGATYSVTANNGGMVTLAGGGAATGVNYGSATAFRLQNGSANGSTNYTITVTDVSDGSCTATTTVMESSCSTTCDLTSAGKTLETCNSNNSNANPSDDYITFSLNPTGTNLGATYSVTANNGGTVTLAGGGAATGVSYGSVTAFRLQNGSADGSTNYTITVTDVSDGSCTATTTVMESSCSTTCNLTSAGKTLETCNPNSTNSNPSDDYITFSLNPIGTNLGATYSVTANNGGTVTLASGGAATGVSYNSVTAFRLQNGSANGSTNYTITVTDVSDGSCTATTTVMESSCSTTCNLTSAGKTLETCNPNSTNSNPSDDYITFSLNPTGTNLGATYSVTANNGGTVTLAGGGAATGVNYGSATAFRLQNGSANGSTNYTITVTDVSDGSCTATTTVMESSCSTTCDLTSAGKTLETCNSNNSNANPSDDYITFSLNPTGTNLGATYSVTANNGGTVTLASGGAATGVSYNSVTAFRLQNGSANGSTNYTITVTDVSDGSCTATTTVMESSCSTTCNLTSAGKTLETCNPNSTNSNPSDDYITFSLNPTGTNLGATYSVTANNGGTVTLAGGGAAMGVSYGSATAFRLQNGSADGSTNYMITVTDVLDGSCTEMTTVMQNSCSATCLPNSSTICNDGSNSVTLTADAGYTNYQWFNEAGALSGETNQALNITSSTNGLGDGTEQFHYRATDGTGCPISLCCPVTIITENCMLDWGDLPDTSASTNIADYQTLLANNGPRHTIIAGLTLGSSVDDETDGQSSNNALGDGGDEDGLMIYNSLDLYPNLTFRLPFIYTNTTGNTAHVEAWVDWNADGAFDGVGEMVADWDDSLGAFPDKLEVTIPADAIQNTLLGFRIRISNQDNMTPYGPQPNGEVEDYLIGIDCPQVCLPIQATIIRQE